MNCNGKHCAEHNPCIPGWPEPTVFSNHVDLAVDADGVKYTTHVFAKPDDPWYGAVILNPALVTTLYHKGLLPLTEVKC